MVQFSTQLYQNAINVMVYKVTILNVSFEKRWPIQCVWSKGVWVLSIGFSVRMSLPITILTRSVSH